MNTRKNIFALASAGFLFFAMSDGLSYGFFNLLRLVVCISSAIIAWMSYQEKREIWVWVFASIAILFNPMFPVYLNRETWLPIDLFVGIFMFISVFRLRLKT